MLALPASRWATFPVRNLVRAHQTEVAIEDVAQMLRVVFIPKGEAPVVARRCGTKRGTEQISEKKGKGRDLRIACCGSAHTVEERRFGSWTLRQILMAAPQRQQPLRQRRHCRDGHQRAAKHGGVIRTPGGACRGTLRRSTYPQLWAAPPSASASLRAPCRRECRRWSP